VLITNDHGYVSIVVSTSRSFPHSCLINGFVTRLTRRVPLVEQKLLTLPEHQSSPPVFRGVRVTRSLVLCVCFVDRCLSLCTFSFGHCFVCSSSATSLINIRKRHGSKTDPYEHPSHQFPKCTIVTPHCFCLRR